MKFFLGTCNPEDLRKTSKPLFVSRRRLVRFKTLPQPCGPWALDSGAFTELQKYGDWTVSAMQYSSEVRGFYQRMGGMQWAAIQDWMCEPIVIKGGRIKNQAFAGTHLSVGEHQRRTVENYKLLKQIAPDLPWCPVLQGFTNSEYWECVRRYEDSGVDLRVFPVVGLGSVCRRQDTAMVEELIQELHGYGLNLHGFGFKIQGIERCAKWLTSADSMAWSKAAVHDAPLPGCHHDTCNNCLKYALKWRREKVLPAIANGMRERADSCLFAERNLTHATLDN